MATMRRAMACRRRHDRGEQWVWLARIRRTQGRKGEVFAEILTDFPEKFAERRRLWLLPVTTRASSGNRTPLPDCESARGGADRPLAAQGWRGAALCRRGFDFRGRGACRVGCGDSARAERAALDEDEVYIGDLIGCTLVDVAGGRAGDSGSRSKMWIEARAGGDAGGARNVRRDSDSVCEELSAAGRYGEKRVEMALPEGLVELNTDPADCPLQRVTDWQARAKTDRASFPYYHRER